MSTTELTIDYKDDKTHDEFHLPISVVKKPRNEKEYKMLEKTLDNLIDIVRDDESHPFTELMQIIGENLESYDDEQYPPIGNDISDVELVKYLMRTHKLYQKDLADIFGGQANVSRFLNGERPLSKKQILGIKKRFGISADFFVH